LKQYDFLLRSGVVDGLGDLEGLFEITVFIVTLSEVEFVLCDFWIEFRELFVNSCRVEEILTHVVAVSEEGHRPTARAELEFVTEMVNGLDRRKPTSWYLAYLMRV
jgi:hypothetical protein